MKKKLNEVIDEIDFAVVDLETTGFSAERDSVIEIAAVKLKAGKIGDKFESLIYTDYVPFYATRVHGIDVDMLNDAPSLNTVRNQFCEFVKGCVLVGHNIKYFDFPFLCNGFEFNCNAYCVDTLLISRILFSQERSHKLEKVAARLGIKNTNYHRALDDALVTAKVFIKFLKQGKNEFKILKDIIA